MRPLCFFEIHAKSVPADSGLSTPVLRGKALSILHAFFMRHPHTYAVGLPDGHSSLRIFASTRDELDALAAYLNPMPWMRDYMNLSYPQAVPAHFKGPWVTFKRYRIPTVRSDRNAVGDESKLRNRRLEHVRESGMNYFMLRSKSNEQAFCLTVETLPGRPNVGDCRPNSYGFSSKSELFSLPDIRQ
jgi:CRISPR-associated endoribonuclease Cas6/Csy4 subtype I-F